MRKAIAILVSALLIATLTLPAMATESSAILVLKDGQPTNVWSQEEEDKAYSNWLKSLEKGREKASAQQGGVVPFVEYPENGTVEISDYYYGTGNLIADDHTTGVASAIWNVVLTVVGTVWNTTAGTIITTAVSLAPGLGGINMNYGASAYLYHSYRYVAREAYVWNMPTLSWVLKVQCNNREWYRTELASYVNDKGETVTRTTDFVPSNGGQAIRIDVSSHFNNSSWIANEAWTRWYTNYPTWYEYAW